MSLTKVSYSMIEGAPVNVLDYGADPTGTTDSTSAIQAAINTGLDVAFPQGTYLANNLTQSVVGQVFIGIGRPTIMTNAAGILLTANGRNWSAQNIIFDAVSKGFSGGCILGTADVQRLISCGARSKTGYAVELRGSSCEIIGTNDIYYTQDATKGPIKMGDTGATLSLYNRIIGIITSTSSGSMLFQNCGSTFVSNCQTNSVDVPFGSGIQMVNCRIVGDLTIGGAFTDVSVTNISGNLTLGDGVNAISGLNISNSVVPSATSTVTINANIRESVICTSQMTNSTIVDNLTGTANDIDNTFYGRPTTYTPVWGGGDGTQTIGNGTLTASYTRNGRSIIVNFNMQMGTTTTYGVGATEYNFSVPITARSIGWQYGAGEMNFTANYLASLRIAGGQNNFIIIYDGYPGPARYNRPEVWISGGRVRGTIEYVTV